jgi:hypothetical protein
MSKAPDWYETYSRDELGMPETWRIFKWEAVGPVHGPRAAQSVVVCGAIVPDKTRGKYKGCPDWKSRDKRDDISLAIPMLALDAFKLKWEANHNACHKCGGDGQELAGWSSTEGSRYRPCSRCNATGLPPAIAA